MSSTLLSHSLMVGLTPLIPIPFVDDMVRSLLLRRMLQALARDRGTGMDDEVLDELGKDETGGCFLGGCAGGCLLMPFRRILRKILFVLEWKRATDLIARAYVYGMLVDDLLAGGWRPGVDGPTAVRVRLAAETAMATVGTSPVVHAVGAVVDGARETLKGAAGLLQRALGSRKAPKEVEKAVDSVEREEEERLGPVAERLAQALTQVPDRYFERLRAEFARELGSEPPQDVPDPAGQVGL